MTSRITGAGRCATQPRHDARPTIWRSRPVDPMPSESGMGRERASGFYMLRRPMVVKVYSGAPETGQNTVENGGSPNRTLTHTNRRPSVGTLRSVLTGAGTPSNPSRRRRKTPTHPSIPKQRDSGTERLPAPYSGGESPIYYYQYPTSPCRRSSMVTGHIHLYTHHNIV